jgi:hypothetical protein
MSSFPALDSEPPPRPIWRTVLVSVAVLAAIALIVVLALTLPGNGRSAKASPPVHPTWSAKVPGTIVSWNLKANTLVDVTASGQLRNAAPVLSHVSSPPQTGPSELLSNNGKVFYVQQGAVMARVTFSSESVLADQPFGSSPFGYFGNSVAEGGHKADGSPLPPFVMNLQSGNSHQLPGAPVAAVAADPLRLGAWVTVVGRSQGRSVDERVEYRTPGKAPVTLVTASRLTHLAGFKGSPGLKLTLYPSPSGRLLAIYVEEAGRPLGAPQEIVVLSRTGQLVARLAAKNVSELAWFDSSRELFFVRSGNSISTWLLGHKSPTTISLPIASGGWGQCVLAPTTQYAACVSFTFDRTISQWALIRLSDGAVALMPTGEIPVDWSR